MCDESLRWISMPSSPMGTRGPVYLLFPTNPAPIPPSFCLFHPETPMAAGFSLCCHSAQQRGRGTAAACRGENLYELRCIDSGRAQSPFEPYWP